MAEPEGAGGERGDVGGMVKPVSSSEIPVRKPSTSPPVLLLYCCAGVAISVFYLFWYAVAYAQPHWPMVWLSIISIVMYTMSIGAVLAGTKRTTVTAICLITFSSVAVILYTAVLSTSSDVHVLYIAIGVAMLTLFPEHLARLRIAYALAIIALVVACEFLFPADMAGSLRDQALDHTVAIVNRMWTLVVVAMAMAVGLYRTTHHQRDLSGAAELGERLANTDPLTGISNRRPVLAKLRELDEAGSQHYAIAIIDIDSFKALNDKYGHDEGDALICAIALRLRGHFRQTDLISRWGGDEFLVLLPSTDTDELHAVLERLRVAVAESPFALGAVSMVVTLSIGVAMTRPDISSHQTVREADRALYTAKQTGRNRVVLAWSAESDETRSA